MKAAEKKQMAEAVIEMATQAVMAYIEAQGDDKPSAKPRPTVHGLEVRLSGAMVSELCNERGKFYADWAKQVQSSDLSEVAKERSVARAQQRARFWFLFADGLDEESDYMLSFDEMELIAGSSPISLGAEPELITLDA